MSICSVKDCREIAVLQWQRAATEDEARAAHEAAQRTQIAILNHARTQAQLHLVELRARHDVIAARAALVDVVLNDDGTEREVYRDLDARAVLPEFSQQVAAAEARHAELLDAEPVRIEPGEVLVAVLACEEHAIDVDAATKLHQPGCLTDGTCPCTLSE